MHGEGAHGHEPAYSAKSGNFQKEYVVTVPSVQKYDKRGTIDLSWLENRRNGMTSGVC